MPVFLRTARGQRLLKRGALLVLFLAVLPNVLYIGHLPLPGLDAEMHIHTPAEARDHANHCHLGPASCGDQPALVGTWWIGEDPIAIAAATDSHPVNLSDVQPRPDAPGDVTTPPPRSI